MPDLFFGDDSDMTITLHAGHPYFDHVNPVVWLQAWNNKWTVRWRDFHLMKQDAEFDTEAEASAYADNLRKPPCTVYVFDTLSNLGAMDQYWRDLAEGKDAFTNLTNSMR